MASALKSENCYICTVVQDILTVGMLTHTFQQTNNSTERAPYRLRGSNAPWFLLCFWRYI